jgi:YegS/Rv2252/BmrU family lipid kinase
VSVTVIVNPASSGGATGQQWPAMASKLEAGIGPFDAQLTQAPGHATALAQQALRDGADTIIAVGGDGTINEVINGFFGDIQSGGELLSPNAVLGIIDAGTGGDFSQNLDLPIGLDAQIAVLRAGHTRPVTPGLASFLNKAGVRERRYFGVLCSFGISSAINHFVNQSPRLKRYGASLAFTVAAIAMIFRFRNVRVTIDVDNERAFSGPCLLMSACIGPWVGGGMKMAPQADIHAPNIDFAIGGDIRLFKRLRLFSGIYRGAHIGQDKVTYVHGHQLAAEALAEGDIIVDMDGDIVGTLPLTINTARQAIAVICNPGQIMKDA